MHTDNNGESQSRKHIDGSTRPTRSEAVISQNDQTLRSDLYQAVGIGQLSNILGCTLPCMGVYSFPVRMILLLRHLQSTVFIMSTSDTPESAKRSRIQFQCRRTNCSFKLYLRLGTSALQPVAGLPSGKICRFVYTCVIPGRPLGGRQMRLLYRRVCRQCVRRAYIGFEYGQTWCNILVTNAWGLTEPG